MENPLERQDLLRETHPEATVEKQARGDGNVKSGRDYREENSGKSQRHLEVGRGVFVIS